MIRNANIINSEDSIYVNGLGGIYRINKFNNSIQTKLLSYSLSSLSVYGKWVCGIEKDSKLIAVEIDGSNYKVIYKKMYSKLSTPIIFENYIFFRMYTPFPMKSHLYRIGINNNNPAELDTSIFILDLMISDDKLYYSKGYNSLYRMNLDGTDKEKVLTGRGSTPAYCINENMVYYSDHSKGFAGMAKDSIKGIEDQKTPLYKVSLDAKRKKPTIVLDNCDSVNIHFYENWLFFNHQKGLYKVKTDGTDFKCINSKYIKDFVIGENSIYYLDGKHTLSKMGLDGLHDTEISIRK